VQMSIAMISDLTPPETRSKNLVFYIILILGVCRTIFCVWIHIRTSFGSVFVKVQNARLSS
jgi:hypothetical protein